MKNSCEAFRIEVLLDITDFFSLEVKFRDLQKAYTACSDDQWVWDSNGTYHWFIDEQTMDNGTDWVFEVGNWSEDTEGDLLRYVLM